MKKNRRNTSAKSSDLGNHQGLMSNSDYLEFLASNKGTKAFMKREGKIKPTRIDNFLTRLYLAL